MKYEVVYEDILTFDEQTEDSEGLTIKGTAFKVGKIASKKIIIPRDALSAITQTLQGSPILTDHSHSVRDLVGRVKKAWSEGDLVKFSGEILDDTIGYKIKKKLISKVSIGLRVDSVEEKEIDGETWSVLGGVQARELSLVVFPAIANAGFAPSFEFNEVEADEPDPITQLGESDMAVMQEFLVSHGRVVLKKEDYVSFTNQLDTMKADYSRMEKTLYLYSNCDEQFIKEMSERIGELTLDQLEFLWGTYRDMSNSFELQGVVLNETDNISSTDNAKEDLRQLIFHSRRSGKWNDKIKSINDINI